MNVAKIIAINHLGDSLQSAYKPVHSTETALIKVKSDIPQHLCNRQGVFLVLFLLFLAAFDTVNHSVLLNRFSSDIGVCGVLLKWFDSYLTGRTIRVCIIMVLFLNYTIYVMGYFKDPWLAHCRFQYILPPSDRLLRSTILPTISVLTIFSYIPPLIQLIQTP